MPSDPLLNTDEVIAGKYRVLRLIGRGGMAEVYAAHHELLHQTVAIKLLLPEVAAAPEATSRFLNEARAAARIRGENIATVLDVGTLPNGTAFMVLEYLEGRDLEALVEEKGRLPVVEAVDYVLQAMQAIAQAHAAGIVHRDLKPSNLFVARGHDGTPVVKVLDFGISKAPRTVDGHSTSHNALLGSPCYMAPEQARSAKSVDARADIWALGVILYRLLTGKLPFLQETLTELLLAIVTDEPESVRIARPDIDPALNGVIMRCLRKKPDERFPNLAELAVALEPFAGPDAGRAVGRISRTLSVHAPTDRPPPARHTQQRLEIVDTANTGAPAAVASNPPTVPTMQSEGGPGTTANWAGSSVAGLPKPRRFRAWAVASVAVLGLGGGLAWRMTHGAPSATATEGITASPPAPSPAPSAVSPPPLPSSAASAPSVATSASTSPPSGSSSVAAAPQPPPPSRPGSPPPRPSPVPAKGNAPPASPSPPSYDVLNQRN